MSEATVNQELEQAIHQLSRVFAKEFQSPAQPADIAALMLAKEVSLLTLVLERIEDRLGELVAPLQPPRH